MDFFGGREMRERGCSCFVSFESLLNIEYKLRKVVKFIF